jgi:DNA polymerase-3 subunit epsilon
LGAVAVAQGRIVEEECFERLVDPGRPIQPSALRVHGITAEMVTGCPPLTEILPEFARFAEGAVLVAHNAAFDMRFLRLKERSAGVRFTQPVLDTMLLSAVLHPHQRSHSLDSLIGRYGVAVRKRHSAKGDAMMTAEVLLKLLPLLERRGIGTLEAALRASRRVPLARLIY